MECRHADSHGIPLSPACSLDCCETKPGEWSKFTPLNLSPHGRISEMRPDHFAALAACPTPVTVTMPRELSRGLLVAVKNHPTTKAANTEEAHRQLGWLLDAWEVMVEHQCGVVR